MNTHTQDSSGEKAINTRKVVIHRQMEARKKFIRGRFAQEQGREEDALREFEQALEIDPDNQCFRDATKVAQRNLHRNLSPLEEHLLVHVQQGYEELAQTLASQKDERWRDSNKHWPS
jgi:tetratricopeptide (TPR) repeat protein